MSDWWSLGKGGIDEGHRLYSKQVGATIERDFEELCARLRHRSPERLDEADMRVIAAFKGRGAYLSVGQANVPEVTERGIALALAGDIEQAIRELCSIRGVSEPVASTILTAADPARFGIIDRLTMGEVVRLIVVRSETGVLSDPALTKLGWAAWKWVRDPDDGRPVAYARFIEGLRERAGELSVTVRELEKALFAYGQVHSALPSPG